MDGRAGAFTLVLPGCPVALLAEAADFTLATPAFAAVAGEASQDIAAAPQSPWGALPARSASIEGLEGLGQGQPLAGGHCLIQLAICIGICVWEGIPCKR